ncbi:MAG TPA: LysM peptidoglycan-binding domain-containing protein [Tahibacter sp.]|nr:LysM peptidoglycan-binding domain-containing protein [Tahibacter sp.]
MAAAVDDSELRQGHPDTYTVKRGDTLWDISARFLKKPWLWPEIWQANPQIENPHLIYPGDVLNLSYLNGKYRVTRDADSGPRVRREQLDEAIEPIPLKDIKEFLKNMRIVDEATYRRLPHIVGVEENRLRVAEGNLVYVKNLEAKSGDQFVIVRQTNVYWSEPPEEKGDAPTTHSRPVDTFFKGEKGTLWHHSPMEFTLRGDVKLLGYEVMVIGSGTVTRTTNPTSLLVTYSDVEIRPGDLVMPIEDKPYDSQYLPRAPAQVPPDFKVLAFTDADNAVGPRQVVALSRGAADGIENGHTFSIYAPGERITDDYKYPTGTFKKLFNPKDSKVTLPEEYLGHVMIFRTFDRVSYGLIMDGIRPVHLGDVLRAPD